jgi:AcrR family transcriptional regulator
VKERINNENTREKIIEISRELFFSSEYSKVTLNEIARRSGVTKGGIYHYFDSKEDLLSAVLIEYFRSLTDGFYSIFKEIKSFKEFLRSWLDFGSHMQGISDEEDEYNFVFQAIYLLFIAIRKNKAMADEVAGIYKSAIEDLKEFIKIGQTKGEIRKDLDSESLALQLLSMVEGGMMIKIISKDNDLKETGISLFETVWKQIKAV